MKPHSFWRLVTAFCHDPYEIIVLAGFLKVLHPLDCDSIKLPKTMTNAQLSLLALNVNPYALYALQNFTLDPECIEPFLRAVGTPPFKFGNLGEYVSMDFLKNFWKLAPFYESVNIIAILLKNPSVNALFDIINAKFPEGYSTPNEGLTFLSQLAFENENLNSSTIPTNKVFIEISHKDIKKIKENLDKEEIKIRKLAKVLKLYIKEKDEHFETPLTLPLVAKAIYNFLENSNNQKAKSIDATKSDIKGLFELGKKGANSQETEKFQKSTLKKLENILKSEDFLLFACDNSVTN